MPNPVVSPTGRVISPKARFISVFVTVFLFVTIISVAITFILPESYASTALIKLESHVHDVPNSSNVSEIEKPFDPQIIQATIAVFQSPEVLNPAMDKLNLQAEWGKKYFNGQTPASEKVLEILKRRMSIAQIRNSGLIGLTIYGDDPKEAAQIANAVAESYVACQRSAAGKSDGLPAEFAHPQITDRAEPGKLPVRPNKPLNIALGVVAGGLLGLFVAGAVVWLAGKRTPRISAA
jgi:uncharacterized protein involved in exopolysaccharide biosynthesis